MEVRESVAIRRLPRNQLAEAVAVAAYGMRDNPINVRVLGGSAEDRTRALASLFGVALDRLSRDGVLLGAFLGDRLAGVAGMAPPGACQPSLFETLGVLPALLTSMPVKSVVDIGRWQGAWRARDLAEPHWHLGPVAIDVHLQRRGIGGELVASCCAHIDAAQAAAYLETDKAVNLRFYERFGFLTISEAPVLGVSNWFMRRPGISPP